MKETSAWKRAIPVAACGVLIALLCTELLMLEGGGWQLHHTLGLAVAVPGFFAWAAARLQLGAAFTTRAEARTLVTRGMYAHVRHPVYVFGFLVVAGVFTFIDYTPLYAVLLILAWHQVRRARREERVLEQAFGDAYRSYRARTWP
jgi:protein-S-isoprenylcysteine O-methyltransferase Ste14